MPVRKRQEAPPVLLAQAVRPRRVGAGPARRRADGKPKPPSAVPAEVKVRTHVGYTFSDEFGTGEVGYSFDQDQRFLLTGGLVVRLAQVEPGMRFHLDGGMVATVTGVGPPTVWNPPSPSPDQNGNSAKRVVGTVRYSGHFPVMDLVVGDRPMKTTPGHRFYSLDRQGWVEAGTLRVGEWVETEARLPAAVRHASPPRTEPIDLYNLEVEDYHTYFVGRPGETSVWSHNGIGGTGCNVPKPAAADEIGAKAATETGEAVGEAASKRSYIFRGDDNYRGGPAGRSLGDEADAADIQNFADHVLRKESTLSSRYTSFTEEIRVARKFTSAADNRYVSKADMALLRDLERDGVIKIWRPEQVYAALKAGPKKLSKQAADVRAAMTKNSEILVEGRIPEGVLGRAN